MPRMKPSGQDEELEFSSQGSNAMIGTPCGSCDSDAFSVSSDWSASKRSRCQAGAAASDAPVAPLAMQAESGMTTTRSRRTLPGLRVTKRGKASVVCHSRSSSVTAAAEASTASVASGRSSSLSSVAIGGASLGIASRPALSLSGTLSHVRPAVPISQGIPLLTANGQSGKRGNDGVLDSVLHRKNFLTQASWPRVMVTLLLDAAATLYNCQANGKALPDIGPEQVIVLLTGNWDYAASTIYPRLDYEDAVTESCERRIADPMARTQEAKAALRALSGGSTPHGVNYSLEQAQRAVRDEEALLQRMREIGAAARLRPSTLRCSAGKDATGCAVLTSCDYRVANRDSSMTGESTLPPCTGLAPERRSGSRASEASLVYGLGCVLHSLVYVSARDRRTHVPPPPATALELIGMAKSTDARRRPSLEGFASHPFMASVHQFLGLESHAAYVDEVVKTKKGLVQAPWWRSSTVALPATRKHTHPVGKVGGRHKHLSVPPPAVIGAATFAAAAPAPGLRARPTITPASTTAGSSSSSRGVSSGRHHSHGTRATVGRLIATAHSSSLRRADAPASSSFTVAWAQPPAHNNSQSAHVLASRDMRRADAALSLSGFASSLSKGYGTSFDEDDEDQGSDFSGVDGISVELAKPATAAEVAGLGLGPASNAATTSSSSGAVPTASPDVATVSGFGSVRDRVVASSQGLSLGAKRDLLSASDALAAFNPHALAEMAPPCLKPCGEHSFGSDLDDDDSSEIRLRLLGYGTGDSGFEEVLGEGIAITKSSDSTSADSTFAMESVIGPSGSTFTDETLDESDWARHAAVATPAFTVDAAMGRVRKRERDAHVAPFGSSATNPFPIPDMAPSATTTKSSSSSSSSSSATAAATATATATAVASASGPETAASSSAWPALHTGVAFMPQSHLASSAQGLAAVSLVPFARSKPIMPSTETLRAAAAGPAGLGPLMPHGLPNAAASVKSAQPLRVSASASPESSPGVTTIAPSPTVADFGSDTTAHTSWQPRALRPVVATDGTPVMSHPAMARQLTGPMGL